MSPTDADALMRHSTLQCGDTRAPYVVPMWYPATPPLHIRCGYLLVGLRLDFRRPPLTLSPGASAPPVCVPHCAVPFLDPSASPQLPVAAHNGPCATAYRHTLLAPSPSRSPQTRSCPIPAMCPTRSCPIPHTKPGSEQTANGAEGLRSLIRCTHREAGAGTETSAGV